MKKIMILIIGFLISSSVVFAQNWKNDPGYSSANYKHPNKAKKASQIETSNQSTQAVAGVADDNRNYKAQNRTRQLTPALLFPVMSNSEYNVTRNYKQQFKPTQRKNTDNKVQPVEEFPETVRNVD